MLESDTPESSAVTLHEVLDILVPVSGSPFDRKLLKLIRKSQEPRRRRFVDRRDERRESQRTTVMSPQRSQPATRKKNEGKKSKDEKSRNLRRPGSPTPRVLRFSERHSNGRGPCKSGMARRSSSNHAVSGRVCFDPVGTMDLVSQDR